MKTPDLVVLTPLAIEHAAGIQTLAADPAIARFTRVPHPYPPTGAVDFVAESCAGRRAGEKYNFAVLAHRENDTFVGCCGLFFHGSERAAAEIGYWIGKPYWGKGYASAAVACLLRFGFEQLKLKALFADCIEQNTASIHVLERNGFRPTGRRRNTEAHWELGESIITFQLLEQDWHVLFTRRE